MAGGRLNKKTTVEDFNLTIEEVEQADLGVASNGTPIAYYVVRGLVKLAKRLGLEGKVRETIITQHENATNQN